MVFDNTLIDIMCRQFLALMIHYGNNILNFGSFIFYSTFLSIKLHLRPPDKSEYWKFHFLIS